MKRIAILGSTGSIGVNTLDVVSKLKASFRVVALSADTNAELLSSQAARFWPEVICIGDSAAASRISRAVIRRTDLVTGPDGLKDIVRRRDVDIVVFAISGNACLEPLIEAIKQRKTIALANKEALVSGGPLVMELAEKYSVKILPIDSEHSAVFQCIEASHSRPARIYLTGSGGPLLNVRAKDFDRLPASTILRHPKWRMGKKISVDSATMMNKGLEIIEASALFGLDESRIDVLIHPEAIIHSMVEFSDRAVLAQLAVPDMRLPIQYALTYPVRVGSSVGRIDFAKLSGLTFRVPDTDRFPSLALARSAARSGGTAPAVLCAADEEAVKLYLAGAIKFTGIPDMIGKVLKRHRNIRGRLSVRDILDADAWAREEARSLCYH